MKMDEPLKGSLSMQIELIKRGVRPVAEITTRKEHLDPLADEVRQNGLRSISWPRGKTHYSLFIFKHHHLATIIRYHLGINAVPRDQELWEIWCAGKLFGYSEESIAAFVKEHYSDQKSIQ